MDIIQDKIKTNNERSSMPIVSYSNNVNAVVMKFAQDFSDKKVSSKINTEIEEESHVYEVGSAKSECDANPSIIAHTNIDDYVNEGRYSSSNSFVINQPTTATTTNEIPPIKSSGLSLLSQYESDPEDIIKSSMTDSFVKIPVPVGCDTYRREGVEGDSSSTSDSDSDNEYLTILRKEINEFVQPLEDDDVDENRKTRQALKVKGEILLGDLPPIQDLQITVPEEECVELGQVHSIVDQLVLVNVLPNSMLFDLETILFLEKGRKVLGAVFDLLGQVSNPLYCVRFNTNEQIKERKINVGDLVYCAPKTQHAQFIILSKLMQFRGSDASWENDIEPPLRHLDYSDDEEEREARNKTRNRHQSTEYIDPEKRKRSSAIAFNNIDKTFSGQYVHKTLHHSLNTDRGSFRMDYDLNNYPNYNSDSWHCNYYRYCHPRIPNSVQPIPKGTSYQHYDGTMANRPPSNIPFLFYGLPPSSDS